MKNGNGWLVLKRERGKSIEISDDKITIQIGISKIDGKHVWVAVKAPPHMLVLREELAHAPQPDAQPEETPNADLDQFGGGLV